MLPLCLEVGEHQQLRNYILNYRPDLRKLCLITPIVTLHINTLPLKISKYILVYIHEVTRLGKIDLTPFFSLLAEDLK